MRINSNLVKPSSLNFQNMSDEEIYEKYKNSYIKESSFELSQLMQRSPALVSRLPLSMHIHYRLFLAFPRELSELEYIFKNMHTRTFLDYAFLAPYTLSDAMIAYIECNFEDLEIVEYHDTLCEVSKETRDEVDRRSNIISDTFDRIRNDIDDIDNSIIRRDSMEAFNLVYDEYIEYAYPF